MRGDVDEMTPYYVISAQKRAMQMGLDPTVVPPFEDRFTAEKLCEKEHEYGEVLAIIKFFVDKFLNLIKGIPILVVVSDAEGYLLQISGDPTIENAVMNLGIRAGVRFTEQECGPNVVNLSLIENAPVRVIGQEHYHGFLHRVACYSVPFHDMGNGNMLGSVSIMTMVEEADEYLLAVLVTAVDSIERELLLRRQNAKLDILNRIMIESTPNAMIVTDERGIIREFNALAERYFGLCASSVIGTSVQEIPHVGGFMYRTVKEQVKYENLQVEIINCVDNTCRVCLFDCLTILDQDQKVLGVLGQSRDITERLHTEQALVRAEKLSVAGQLGAALAHEIRNPLTSVQGFLQLMSESKDVPQTYIPIMVSELKRIEGIIAEFLHAAKPQQPNHALCNIVNILRRSVTLIEPMANMNGIRIRMNSLAGECVVFGDVDRLKQVFVNLLRNAVESMNEPGNVSINVVASPDVGYVFIEIADEGCGIDRSTLARLGTPFYTTKDRGTGLGLTVSSQILEQHRGTIHFLSEVNQGTTVFVKLPLCYDETPKF